MANLYKILSQEDWLGLLRDGRLLGAGIDLRDGYVHLSSGAQVRETLRLHYPGRSELRLVVLDEDALDTAALRWEPSRGGALFPHLYGPLPLAAMRGAWTVDVSAGGAVALPRDLDEGTMDSA